MGSFQKGLPGKIDGSRFGRAHCAILALVLALFAFPFLGCNFDYPKDGAAKPAFPLTESPGYEQIRALILEPNCLGCHSTRSPLLTSYESVVAALDQIEDTVVRETPRNARRKMPPNRPLDANLVSMLDRWIRDGAPRDGGDPLPSPLPSVSPTPIPGESIPRPVTYEVLKAKVLAPKCLLCHATDNPDDNPAFDTYAGFLGYASVLEQVVMGLKGTTVVPPEKRMPPPDAKPITAEEKAYILLWLNDGMLEKKETR